MPICTRSVRATRQRCTREAVEWPGHRVDFGQPMTDWPDLPRAVVCWTHLSSDERSRYLEGRRRQGEDTRAVWAARRAALQLDAVAIERPAESDAELRLLSEREAMLAAALWALADAESAMVEGAVRPGPGSGRTRAPEAGDAGGEAPVRHE